MKGQDSRSVRASSPEPTSLPFSPRSFQRLMLTPATQLLASHSAHLNSFFSLSPGCRFVALVSAVGPSALQLTCRRTVFELEGTSEACLLPDNQYTYPSGTFLQGVSALCLEFSCSGELTTPLPLWAAFPGCPETHLPGAWWSGLYIFEMVGSPTL